MRGRSKKEDEAWLQVDSFYNAHYANVVGEIERGTKAREQSAKAKGKQRAASVDPDSMDVDPSTVPQTDEWEPRDQDLPERFRSADGSELARRILAEGTSMASALGKTKGKTKAGSEAGEVKSRMRERLGEVEFKLDRLHAWTNSALQTTNIAETDLDHRFALLSFALASRSAAPPAAGSLPTTSLSVLAPAQAKALAPGKGIAPPDPQDLLRALTRVDAERPPAQIGDTARRAVREAQRAQEGGGGERRLTGVIPRPATPSRRSGGLGGGGTPRRTPARDRG